MSRGKIIVANYDRAKENSPGEYTLSVYRNIMLKENEKTKRKARNEDSSPNLIRDDSVCEQNILKQNRSFLNTPEVKAEIKRTLSRKLESSTVSFVNENFESPTPDPRSLTSIKSRSKSNFENNSRKSSSNLATIRSGNRSSEPKTRDEHTLFLNRQILNLPDKSKRKITSPTKKRKSANQSSTSFIANYESNFDSREKQVLEAVRAKKNSSKVTIDSTPIVIDKSNMNIEEQYEAVRLHRTRSRLNSSENIEEPSKFGAGTLGEHVFWMFTSLWNSIQAEIATRQLEREIEVEINNLPKLDALQLSSFPQEQSLDICGEPFAIPSKSNIESDDEVEGTFFDLSKSNPKLSEDESKEATMKFSNIAANLVINGVRPLVNDYNDDEADSTETTDDFMFGKEDGYFIEDSDNSEAIIYTLV